MNALRRMQLTAPKYPQGFRCKRYKSSRTYMGLPGQGGQWMSHWHCLKESFRQPRVVPEHLRVAQVEPKHIEPPR